jgi:hypothetical protein
MFSSKVHVKWHSTLVVKYSSILHWFFVQTVKNCIMCKCIIVLIYIGLCRIYRVIQKSVKHFKNSQQIDYATDHGNSYADRDRNATIFLHISLMLNVSTFGNTVDIYAISHLVPHACQHISVDGHTCYYCLLAANQGNYVRELFTKKKLGKFLSLSA